MAVDPVCGMYVDEEAAEYRTNPRETTYCFCSKSCMDEFLAPERELPKLRRELAAAVLLTVPILALTYVSPIPKTSTAYVLFALDTPLQFFIGWRFYRGGFDGLTSRMGNRDLLIAAGTSAAWVFSTIVTLDPGALPDSGIYFDSAAVVVTLVLGGRYLEHFTKNRASYSLRKLLALQPQTARLVREDRPQIEIPIEEVELGDVLAILPGERVPVDGMALEGTSVVDESMITGGRTPREKRPGDELIGATENISGSLRMRAERVGRNAVLYQIVELVEAARAGVAPIQRVADRVASRLVPVAIGLATIAALTWYFIGNAGPGFSVLIFVSVVVIASPCALGEATAAAVLVGTSRGAQFGILFRGGECIERLAKVNTVVFDKTGTLTFGRPLVTDVVPVGGVTPASLMRFAGAAERASEHPVGRSVFDEAVRRGIALPEPSEFEAMPGVGVRARVDGKAVVVGTSAAVYGADLSGVVASVAELQGEGKTAVVVFVDGRPAGVLGVADRLRPSAREVVTELKSMGMGVVMLTGDNSRVASSIAKEAGIERVVAEVPPQEKEHRIEAIRRGGENLVAMVGDGVSDSQALAQADVGIALGSGSDIANETGGVVIIESDLASVVIAAKLARRTLSKIKQNLVWAFAYNLVLIPTAAGALAPFVGIQATAELPFVAALATALSSLTVLSNSLLLFRFRPPLEEHQGASRGVKKRTRE
jgi:Cu+-exporting ATPase